MSGKAPTRSRATTQPRRKLFEFDEGDPRLAVSLSLVRQKKRAKSLLKAALNSDDEALSRFRTHHPSPPTDGTKIPKLADAQLVIAREFRFHSWADFKHHLQAAKIALEAIKNGQPESLDAGRDALHIRCGNDIEMALEIAGFKGAFHNFSDPFVEGPTPRRDTFDEFIDTRTRYMIDSGHISGTSKEAAQLRQGYDGLAQARKFKNVYLWFEHDSFDLLIWCFLVAHFAGASSRPANLHHVCITNYPGVKKFIGLGHLPPDAMRVIWERFEPVTDALYSLGQTAWDAITAPTPEPLFQLIQTGIPLHPPLAIALKRHLQQLPSTSHGLSLSEYLALNILKEEGKMEAGRLFGRHINHYEPLPFMGDSSFWNVLNKLANAPHPALKLANMPERSDRGWPMRTMAELTSLGERLVAGEADWLALNPADFWVGGVRIKSGSPRWRWDDTNDAPVLTA